MSTFDLFWSFVMSMLREMLWNCKIKKYWLDFVILFSES